MLIAGAGPAAIEGLLALRRLLPRTQIELIAPDEEFTLRALAVREPFGHPRQPRLTVERICELTGARQHREALTHVDPERRRVTLASGAHREFATLLVAIGGRQIEALPGVSTFWGAGGDPAFVELLAEVERSRGELEFLVPHRVRWSLPLYELAMATAEWFATRDAGMRITVLTPEVRPLIVLGGEASAEIERQLAERGIGLRTSVDPLSHIASSSARRVALPRLVGRPLPELPQAEDGFLPTDEFGRVTGVEHVYAAGDATDSTIKQGGLATQQADAAASAIFTELTGEGEPLAAEEVLRAEVAGDSERGFLSGRHPLEAGTAAASPTWQSGAKIFGRHLSPFLAAELGATAEPSGVGTGGAQQTGGDGTGGP